MSKYVLFLLLFGVCLTVGGSVVYAQDNKVFSDPNVDYTFEIPDDVWKVLVNPSSSNPNVEMVYGDRLDGYMEVRKVVSSEDEALSDVMTRDQEQKLQFLSGYVAGKEENFAGYLKGKVFNFEFNRSGKNMSGRFYFLKADPKTIYVLRFTGLRDNLARIRNQIDQIARSFKVLAPVK